MRPAKECNCERSTEENVVSGETCDCGLRKSDQCNSSPSHSSHYFSWGCSRNRRVLMLILMVHIGTCEKNPTAGLRDGEIDFTTRK